MSGRLSRSSNNDCRVYVGNLPQHVRERDLEDVFYKFGKVGGIDIHDKFNPAFAFVEFEDPRDARDAIDARDGYEMDGYRIRVEYPRGHDNSSERGGYGGGRARGGFRGKGRGYGPPRRSDNRVLVSGLPSTGSWQDLKDHMREAGDVLFTDVFRDGTGVVEFAKYDDMKWAVKNLDDTKFRSHETALSDFGNMANHRDNSYRRGHQMRRRGRLRCSGTEANSGVPGTVD